MEYDLWGNPVYSRKGKKGRPPFERTEENAHKVSMLLALGWTNERIAGCILDPRTGKSISVPTLKRHFRSELQVRDVARDQLNAARFLRVMEAADKGNVGAMRLLGQMIDQNDMMLAAKRIRDAQKGSALPEDTPSRKAPLGKKEAEKLNAERVANGGRAGGWGNDLKPGVH